MAADVPKLARVEAGLDSFDVVKELEQGLHVGSTALHEDAACLAVAGGAEGGVAVAGVPEVADHGGVDGFADDVRLQQVPALVSRLQRAVDEDMGHAFPRSGVVAGCDDRPEVNRRGGGLDGDA